MKHSRVKRTEESPNFPEPMYQFDQAPSIVGTLLVRVLLAVLT